MPTRTFHLQPWVGAEACGFYSKQAVKVRRLLKCQRHTDSGQFSACQERKTHQLINWPFHTAAAFRHHLQRRSLQGGEVTSSAGVRKKWHNAETCLHHQRRRNYQTTLLLRTTSQHFVFLPLLAFAPRRSAAIIHSIILLLSLSQTFAAVERCCFSLPLCCDPKCF